MTQRLDPYRRIAPFYDALDLPFERWRYRALRPLLFEGLGGRLLDAGIGTGRNCAFYPVGAEVSGIDLSPAMLARARRRCPTVSAAGRLYRMDTFAAQRHCPTRARRTRHANFAPSGRDGEVLAGAQETWPDLRPARRPST